MWCTKGKHANLLKAGRCVWFPSLEQCWSTLILWLFSQHCAQVWMCVMCLRYRVWHVYFRDGENVRARMNILCTLHTICCHATHRCFKTGNGRNAHIYRLIKQWIQQDLIFFFFFFLLPSLSCHWRNHKVRTGYLHLLCINHQLSLSLCGWL